MAAAATWRISPVNIPFKSVGGVELKLDVCDVGLQLELAHMRLVTIASTAGSL